MSETTKIITYIFSFFTVGGDVLVLGLLMMLAVIYFKKGCALSFKIVDFFGKNAILFSFVVTIAAILGSLYYSEIVGFEPCGLCWIQRIFIYPQAIILGIALLKKDKGVADYCIALSVIGGLFSAYHQYIQFGGHEFFACSSEGTSCAQRLVWEFGYVTIPMMTLTLFLMIIVFMVAQKQWLKK